MKFSNIPERRILAFGDSNTHGYLPGGGGRYSEAERWPCLLQQRLGAGWRVIEEGLPGRASVFQDPLMEGRCGLPYLAPCMISHAPLDLLLIMLGTNDTKERFGCNAELIAGGILLLAQKALATDAWRAKPEILLICPPPIHPSYRSLAFGNAMGDGCAEKSLLLPKELERAARGAGFHFIDSGSIPGVSAHPADGIHLTLQGHAALAAALAAYIEQAAL